MTQLRGKVAPLINEIRGRIPKIMRSNVALNRRNLLLSQINGESHATWKLNYKTRVSAMFVAYNFYLFV